MSLAVVSLIKIERIAESRTSSGRLLIVHFKAYGGYSARVLLPPGLRFAFSLQVWILVMSWFG